ncbi:MAG TPA: HNH endonuclease signature motif containing protein, partial [Acidimicrobiia bacterium]
TQSDLDHNRPWSDDGPTETENLGPLCRHHHVIRHHGWTIHQVDLGVYRLTSPLGHTYTTQPRAP